MSEKPFHYLKNPTLDQIKATATDFLMSLPGPTVIDIEGSDQARTRIVSTLVHGNEPSGLGAIHSFLTGNDTPATNVRFILPSIQAAKHPPMLTHRFLPGERDLNRCFDSVDNDPIVRRAKMVQKFIQEASPEAVIDMHNTSGSGPAFGVTVSNEPAERTLVSFFSKRAILTALNVGSLMEQDFGCPIVTIECGGCNDEIAHTVAREGLRDFLLVGDLLSQRGHETVEVLDNPVRVELADSKTIAYSADRVQEVDFSLYVSIEHLNTGTTPAGTAIGWANSRTLDGLIVRNEDHSETGLSLFMLQGDCIRTTHPMHIFMATTRADIAKGDCLFYAVMVDEAA